MGLRSGALKQCVSVGDDHQCCQIGSRFPAQPGNPDNDHWAATGKGGGHVTAASQHNMSGC